MQIYVCIKHVPDSAANIHLLDNTTIDENISFLLNPYDEHAVTEAAALKEQFGDAEIIAVCLGKEDAQNTIRSAMAMGADRGILVETNDSPDSRVTARALKAAIEKDGTPALIFTGKESIDAEGMQTMFRIGALFNFPVVNNVVALATDSHQARVTYETGAGKTRTCQMAMPCVIGAGRGLNTPAYPTFPQIVKSRKKKIDTMAFKDLNIEIPKGGTKLIGLKPMIQDRSAKAITGSPADAAAKIITILKEEAKVL